MNNIYYDYFQKYLKMFLSLLLISFAYNLFVYPINLVAGGSGGLGVLFSYLFSIDSAVIVFIVSFLMLMIAYLYLDFDDILSCFFVTIFFPILIKATSGVASLIQIDTSHILVITLFGAILTGIGQGLIFKEGLNIGGFSVIAKVINKHSNVSITLINAIINIIIIIIGGIFINFSMVFYAIIFVLILRFVSEKIMLGISNNKTFKIISDDYEVIQKYIHETLGHDVTIYDTVGSFEGKKKKLIMTVIPTSEFILLRDYVKSVDSNAFIFVTNTYEASMQDVMISKGKN